MTRPDSYYELHQAALLPASGVKFKADWKTPDTIEVAGFGEFLVRQKLHGIWVQALIDNCPSEQLKQLKAQLEAHLRLNTALELPQQRSMQEAHELLTGEDIPYFFAKGAQLRNVAYQQPWHRPSSDVDVFIEAKNRERAIKAFEDRGFSTHSNPATISHEINLEKFGSYIDLHWHLLRPSRYRQSLDHWLFQRRRKFGEFWGLDATANLLVMLTHPAITKYLISPTSMLIHQVDQLKLIENEQVDWQELYKALHDSGLKTAAWSSTYLLQLLTGWKVNHAFELAIRPSRLKRHYIQAWIDNAWITKQFERRWMVAGGFSLALQDTTSDTARACLKTLTSRLTAFRGSVNT